MIINDSGIDMTAIMDQYTVEQLEGLSTSVAKGEAIGFIDAMAVIEYQSTKPKKKSWWSKVWNYIKPSTTYPRFGRKSI